MACGAAARGAQLNVRRADALCSALEHLYFGIALALNLNPPWVGLKAGFYCAGLNPGLALGPLLVGLNPGLNRGAFPGVESGEHLGKIALEVDLQL